MLMNEKVKRCLVSFKMFYKILTCFHNKRWFERKKINFTYNFSFGDCPCCLPDLEVFVIRWKYCLYNVTGFARNYFVDIHCLCVNTDKDEVCKHCKQRTQLIFWLWHFVLMPGILWKKWILWKLTITLKTFWTEAWFSTFRKKNTEFWFPLANLIGVIFWKVKKLCNFFSY